VVHTVTLASQEAEIRRIVVRSQPRQIVFETLSQKNLSPKKGLVEGAQGVGPEFKPQDRKIINKFLKFHLCWEHRSVGEKACSVCEVLDSAPNKQKTRTSYYV
jgi:hypothetical protein